MIRFLCVVLLFNGLIGTNGVSRVRLIDHTSYAISVIQEAMIRVERRCFCNLKIDDIPISINQTVLGERVVGEVKLRNGFVTSIQSWDLIQHTVQQVWLSASPGTVEVRSTLRFVNMQIGFDVEINSEEGIFFSTATILYPETRFSFNISNNLFKEEISTSIISTVINPRTSLMLLPENSITKLLPSLYEWDSISNSVDKWASDIFQQITQEVVDNVVPFPKICYDCPV